MKNNRRKYYIVAAAILLSACVQTAKQEVAVTDENAEEAAVESIAMSNDFDEGEEEGDSLSDGKSLNDIRFADFEEKDWYDNEYIRTLRKYLDAFNKGEIEDEELEPYRDAVKGKFVIYEATPFIGGGMYLFITFFDNPKNLFTAWVYSDVDTDTETVIGYHVQGISWKSEIDITKEEILEVMREHPENKLW